MKKLFWFAFQDHHRRRKPWGVFFVDKLEDQNGGLCFRPKREVYILAALSPRRIMELVGHELVHAACTDGKCQTDLESEGEEYTAVSAEAAMVPIIASLGGVIPPLPEGFAAFKKAARGR